MVDLIYNVLARPIANTPNKKDASHVDRAPKDQRAKRIEDDDPSDQGSHSQNRDQELDQKLDEHKEGKGKYQDDDGVEHLDIFV